MSDESCIITDTVAKLKNIFVNCRRLKVQKYSVSIGFSYSDRSSYEHSNEQFAYAVFLYSKPYDVFEQKDIPIFVFFFLLRTPLKTLYMLLRSIKYFRET